MTEAAETPPRIRTPLGSVRASSARALLLVVLGEFVWPTLKPTWSSTLLTALADLDVEPNAARKALHRTSVSGLMETVREGRRVRWLMTPQGHRVMAAGHERIYEWDARDMSWDGQWLILSVTVPESQRRLRHHLQSRLAWAGLGSPVPGQWLSPHWERGEEIAQMIADLGLEEQSHAFVGRLGPVGDEERLVNAAWNLHELKEEYETFISTYSAMTPRTDHECMRARVHLVQDWRRFPYLDPDLPKQFLPASWPGYEASRTFRDRHNAWAVRSARHWKRIEATT